MKINENITEDIGCFWSTLTECLNVSINLLLNGISGVEPSILQLDTFPNQMNQYSHRWDYIRHAKARHLQT